MLSKQVRLLLRSVEHAWLTLGRVDVPAMTGPAANAPAARRPVMARAVPRTLMNVSSCPVAHFFEVGISLRMPPSRMVGRDSPLFVTRRGRLEPNLPGEWQEASTNRAVSSNI